MLRTSRADVEARLGGVRAPTLVVMGTRDSDFTGPAAVAEWLAGRLGGTARLVEGAGHYPHAELPEQVGRPLTRFLSTTVGRCTDGRLGAVARGTPRRGCSLTAITPPVIVVAGTRIRQGHATPAAYREALAAQVSQ